MQRELISFDRFRSIGPDKFNQTISDIHMWVNENLKHGVDYEWSIALFSYTDRTGTNEYPYGIFLFNEDDRVAFKLKFNL